MKRFLPLLALVLVVAACSPAGADDSVASLDDTTVTTVEETASEETTEPNGPSEMTEMVEEPMRVEEEAPVTDEPSPTEMSMQPRSRMRNTPIEVDSDELARDPGF